MTQSKTRSAMFSRLALLAGVGVAALGLGLLGHELSSAYLVDQSFQPFEELDSVGGQLPQVDFDRVLAESESQFENASGLAIKSGQRKRIVWPRMASQHVDSQPAQLAIVYVHGFSAGPLELEPTVSTLAKELAAPLVFTRLAGHGLENSDGAASEAMARASARDWWKDIHEAMAIGHSLAKQVLLVGTSTGASLALTYAEMKELSGGSSRPSGLILLSPNYRVRAFGAWILEAALGRWLATLFLGREREFASVSKLHAERWTTRYRSEALHEMLLVAKRARGVKVESLALPVLTVYSPNDSVVEISEIKKRATLFRHPKSETLGVDWLKRHELASAVFDPHLVPRLVETLRHWVRSSIEIEVGAREPKAEPGDR